nr:hypothetical protein [uncultured Cohaesibacter sp.]
MCLMKLEYTPEDGNAIRIENVFNVRTTDEGLVVETLLDGRHVLPAFKLVALDCSQGWIRVSPTMAGELAHV